MKGLADMLAEAPEEAEEGEEGAEIEAAIDDLEASSNIVVSDRKAFGDAIAALMLCCDGGYEEGESKGKHSIAILLGGGKK